MEQLALRPGVRVLNLGTGPGITCAVASRMCGADHVVSLDSSVHVTEAARVHLARLGLYPTLVTGPGEDGWADAAPYDRVFASYAVPRVPGPWLEQLAPGGLALAHITSGSPSWPALAVITKTAAGAATGELRPARYGHRAGHGLPRLFLSKPFVDLIDVAENTSRTHSRYAPPPSSAAGFWIMFDTVHPGAVRRTHTDEQLVIGAPACRSWVSAAPATGGQWAVSSCGPRDIWAEIQDTAARWRAAGSLDTYRIHFDRAAPRRSPPARVRPRCPGRSLPYPRTDSPRMTRRATTTHPRRAPHDDPFLHAAHRPLRLPGHRVHGHRRS